MGALVNLCGMATATTGTGTVTLGAALTGLRTLTAAGGVSGTAYSYSITDGTDQEVGIGVWTSGANTLTRTLVSSTTGSLLSLSGSAQVRISPIAADFSQGKQTIFVPAAAMVPRITSGPSDAIGETATNRVMRRTLDFDATTAEFAQFAIAMPKSWNEGTVTYQVLWSHAATTTNFGVVWTLAGVAMSDGDALEAAFGTAISVVDTGGTTDTLYISPESAAVTIAGTPAEFDQITLQLGRAPADVSDTMAVDARLHGVRLFYITNSATDD